MSEDKLKVVDIFYSLQGEGYRQGQPTLFVRFSGCNLSCDFCDESLHKVAPVTAYSVDHLSSAILKLLSERGCDYICFTGGEPLLQKSLGALIQAISDKFYGPDGWEQKIFKPDNLGFQIETNGTLPLVCAGIDYSAFAKEGYDVMDVAIAPKVGKKINESWLDEDLDSFAISDVKVVFREPTAETVLNFLEYHFGEDFINLWNQAHMWLQPVNRSNEVDTFELYRCVDAIWKLSEQGYSFGLSSQIHKFINIK